MENVSEKICLHGTLQSAKASTFMPVINPATLEKIGRIPLCAEQDIDTAIQDSEQAFAQWKRISAPERGRLLRECALLFQKHAASLAHTLSLETGKALRTESRVELSVVADTFYFYSGLALELKGETIPHDPEVLSFTLREPLGVVTAIIPWNVPLMLMAMKIAPALIAGNTVILKPSPEASFSVLQAVAWMNEILPPGVLNVLTGDGTTGKLLVRDPRIKKLSFTGSVESGRSVYEGAAEHLIPVTLELGGKSPFIVFPDADLDQVVQCAYEGMRFTRQGQSCSASSRFLIHHTLQDTFVEKLLARLNQDIIGDPLNEKTDIGTMISERQFNKVQHFIQLAENDPSLKIHYASQLPTDPRLQKGLFVRPALVTGLNNHHAICQKEIFGPIAAVLSWSSVEEAIKMANDTEFGLAAGVWTRDLPTALQMVQQLEAGFVQVNQYKVYRPSLPFGGFKHSGIGKEASLAAMLEHYTRVKTVLINTVVPPKSV